MTTMKSVSVELTVFSIRDGQLDALLVRRPGTTWTLPGTVPAPDEPLRDAASRALRDQTAVTNIQLEQLYTFDRAERGMSVAYIALIAARRHPLSPGADTTDVRWFRVEDPPTLAADAQEALAYGHERLRAKSTYAPIAVQLLPDTFTLGDLQAVYETVLGHGLDSRNFRRDVLHAEMVAPTGGVRADGRGRPARLYRWTGADFSIEPGERRAARRIAAIHGIGGGNRPLP